ncbi:integrase core domain-containing protein [Hirsutella rhossiliensis]
MSPGETELCNLEKEPLPARFTPPRLIFATFSAPLRQLKMSKTSAMATTKRTILTEPQDWDRWVKEIRARVDRTIHKLIFRDGSNALEPPNRPSFTDFAEEATHYVDLNSINQRAYSVATADYESRPITESISTAKLTSLREGDTLRQWLQKLEASTAPSRGFMTDRIRKQVYQALRPDSIGSTPTLAALVARKSEKLQSNSRTSRKEESREKTDKTDKTDALRDKRPHGVIRILEWKKEGGLATTEESDSRKNQVRIKGYGRVNVTVTALDGLVSFQALRDEGIYWDTFTEPTRLVYRDKRPICILFRKYRQFVLDFQPIQKEDIEEAVFKPLSREEEAPGTQDRQRQQKLAFGMPD